MTNTVEYMRKWRAANPDKLEQYKAKRREQRRNRPAGAVGGRAKDPDGVENWLNTCYSTAYLDEEISWDINLEKYMEGNVNE